MKKLQQGQSLYFVGTSAFHKRQGTVTVESVGRKWANITGTYIGRIDIVTLQADSGGYASPGRCYASRQDWLDAEAPRLAWRQLVNGLSTGRPEAVSLADIQQAAKLLGVELNLPSDKDN